MCRFNPTPSRPATRGRDTRVSDAGERVGGTPGYWRDRNKRRYRQRWRFETRDVFVPDPKLVKRVKDCRSVPDRVSPTPSLPSQSWIGVPWPRLSLHPWSTYEGRSQGFSLLFGYRLTHSRSHRGSLSSGQPEEERGLTRVPFGVTGGVQQPNESKRTLTVGAHTTHRPRLWVPLFCCNRL